jgi:hypothetical protein
MRSDVLNDLFAEENVQPPVYSLPYLSVIGRGTAQWKKIETKAFAFNATD